MNPQPADPESANPFQGIALLLARTPTVTRLAVTAGWSLQLMAAVFVLGSIVATWYLNALMIDVGAIIVFFLGAAIRNGSRKATWWAVAFLLAYHVMVGMMLVSLFLGSGKVQLGGRPIQPEEISGVVAVMIGIGLLTTVNLGFLIALLLWRQPTETKATQA